MIILLIDDDEIEFKNWKRNIDFYSRENPEVNISLIFARSVEEAKDKIDSSDIDFIVVDYRLDGSFCSDFLVYLKRMNVRIPIIVFTATPDDIEDDGYIIKTFKKGDEIISIIKYIVEINSTGIANLISFKGKIEQALNSFYQIVFKGSINTWIERQEKNKDKTEKSLCRCAINSLYSYFESSTEEDQSYFEEFYCVLSSGDQVHVGSILKMRETGDYHVVVSPSCDVFQRSDGANVDIITLVKIVNIPFGMKSDNKKNYFSNSRNRFHYIPKLDFFGFNGGFADFNQITTVDWDQVSINYELSKYRISHPFISNLCSRFAMYYSRQGQPDLDDTELKKARNALILNVH